MHALIHCIYTSVATVRHDADTLARLLADARARNQADGITGVLLLSGDTFFQVLEGTPAAVDACFGRIERDRRHAAVTRIVREVIGRRTFPDWTMGFSELTPAEIERLEGMNDFFQAGRCLEHIDSGRAKRLLHAFAAGRWRMGGAAPQPSGR